MQTLRSSFGVTRVSSPALLFLDGDGRTIHAGQDTPPASRMEGRHEFFPSPRLRREVGMSAFFALIPGEGTPPQVQIRGGKAPSPQPARRKRGEGAASFKRRCPRSNPEA